MTETFCSSWIYYRRWVQSETVDKVKYLVELKNVYDKRFNIERLEWSCTCKAFLYGHGNTCKHCDEAYDEWCGWEQEVNGSKPVLIDGMEFCPECGRTVITKEAA